MTLLRKIMVMALLGALGAAAAALLGEALFHGDGAKRQQPREICLLFDVSTSMREKVEVPGSQVRTTQLEALQDAASTFVDRQDFALDTMALTVFAWEAQVVTGLTRDGVFWIEDGEIAHPLTNYRFNDSPISVLKNVDAMAAPVRVPPRPSQAATVVVPPLRTRFALSSVSEAV